VWLLYTSSLRGDVSVATKFAGFDTTMLAGFQEYTQRNFPFAFEPRQFD